MGLTLEQNYLSYFTKKQYTQRHFSVGCLLVEILQVAKSAQVSWSPFTRIKPADLQKLILTCLQQHNSVLQRKTLPWGWFITHWCQQDSEKIQKPPVKGSLWTSEVERHLCKHVIGRSVLSSVDIVSLSYIIIKRRRKGKSMCSATG